MPPAEPSPSKIPTSRVFEIFSASRPAFDNALVDRFYVITSLFNEAVKSNDSLYLWGCLVKSWATGVNHFPGKAPTDPIPSRPQTRADLVALLVALGINHHMPERFTKVAFCQTDADTLAIRLPAKDTLLSKEKDFLAGAGYQLSAFYSALFGHGRGDTPDHAEPAPPSPLKPLSTDKDTSMYVHTLRVGEYSMNNCA